MNKGIEDKLNELVKEIGSIPTPQKKKLFTLIKRTDECRKKLDQSIDGLQDSLDSLRLSVKYLIFDLEATRRENSELKKALEEKDNQ